MGEDGEWEAPMIDNPDYHGDWSVKRISNPAYKGFWEAKKIDNPEYEDDNAVYKHDDFGFIGFDLWQVKGGTIFDNVIVCDDKSEADAFAAKWKAISRSRKQRKRRKKRRRRKRPRRRKTKLMMTMMIWTIRKRRKTGKAFECTLKGVILAERRRISKRRTASHEVEASYVGSRILLVFSRSVF